ncbi:hypothetical protein MBLNU457_6238t1 [Dothideomycetes sp. NU457]
MPSKASANEHSPGAFPSIHAVSRLVNHDAKFSKGLPVNNHDTPVYDVKFYPYTEPDDDAVFAIVAGREVFICRPTPDTKEPLEILGVFRDPQEDIELNSAVWSQDVSTLDPLICFAGAGSKKIKIANVITGQFNLSGHGGNINDLAISPKSPTILVSASDDHSLRLWNLDPEYSKHSCAAIFGGAGHKEHVLTVAFHQEGSYILSGGSDTMVNLWAVPSVPDANANTDKTTQVHYPLFSSIEVHSDYVDCVRFHGDLILSHAATGSTGERKNAIHLWKIDGFNSADPIPEDPPLPGPNIYTRSAFGGRFQRLLTFDMPDTMTFYTRFGLFDGLSGHPMLVMGNSKSKYCFWDLQKLEQGPDAQDLPTAKRGSSKRRGGGYAGRGAKMGMSALARDAQAQAQADERSASASAGADNDSNSAAAMTPVPTGPMRTGNAILDAKFDPSDPFRPIPPHHTVTVPKYNFLTRQCAWSNDGRWLVGTGQMGLIVIMKRW